MIHYWHWKVYLLSNHVSYRFKLRAQKDRVLPNLFCKEGILPNRFCKWCALSFESVGQSVESWLCLKTCRSLQLCVAHPANSCMQLHPVTNSPECQFFNAFTTVQYFNYSNATFRRWTRVQAFHGNWTLLQLRARVEVDCQNVATAWKTGSEGNPSWNTFLARTATFR